MRAISNLVEEYEKALPRGWRAIIELQRANDRGTYYELDVCSEKDAGGAAPTKMQALRVFPDRSHTGYAELETLRGDLHKIHLHEDNPELFAEISRCGCVHDIPISLYQKVEDACGISLWYGGIRVPYDILVTDKNQKAQDSASIHRTTGEIRVVFSGAKEWQDTFFAFRIMNDVQRIMAKRWKRDQITFSTTGLSNGDAHVAFMHQTIPLLRCPR